MNIRSALFTAIGSGVLAAAAASGLAAAPPCSPIVADPGTAHAIITPEVEFFEDTGATITPQQITDPEINARFSPVAAPMFYAPWSASAFWMRYTLSNPSGKPLDKLLVVDCQFIDTLETFSEESGALQRIQTTGRHFAFGKRPAKYRTFCVPLRLAPHSQQTLYHRIRSTEVLTTVVYLWDPEPFYRSHRTILLLYGIFYGLSGAVFLATTALFIVSRRPWYLHYGLMLLFMHVLFTMGRQGLSQEFLFPQWPMFATLAHLSFACLGQIFSLLLTKSFLKFNVRPWAWRLAFYGQIAVLGVTALLPFFIGYRPVSAFLTNISCFSFVIILAMSGIAVARGNRAAVFFLVAWVCHLAGASTVILRSWGLLSSPFFMDHGYQIGITFELFLISAAMAYSIYAQRRDILLAHNESFRVKKLSIDNLKKAILSRIQERQAHVDPDFLFNALNTISHQTKTEPQTANADLEKLSAFYRNVLSFSQRSLIKLSQEIELVDLYMHFEKKRFGDRISFSMDVGPGLGDRMVPGLLIQPLVENALEHRVLTRLSGGRVWVSVTGDADSVAVSVKDDGAGMPVQTITESSLGSIRERLELLYEDTFSMDVKNDDGAAITITIPRTDRLTAGRVRKEAR
jgi:hypothetical protein